MAEMTLTRMRLAEGVWEGLLLAARETPPRLTIRHRDQLVAEAETEGTAERPGHWLVRFRLPVERIADGVQTFIVENAETGEALAHETIVSGTAAQDDIRAELDLVRAELDMLKRAFRRHCTES